MAKKTEPAPEPEPEEVTPEEVETAEEVVEQLEEDMETSVSETPDGQHILKVLEQTKEVLNDVKEKLAGGKPLTEEEKAAAKIGRPGFKEIFRDYINALAGI